MFFLFSLLVLLLALRFQMDLVNMNGFMQPARFIYQVTDPIFIPLKKEIFKGNKGIWVAPCLIWVVALLFVVLRVPGMPLLTMIKISLLYAANMWLDALKMMLFAYAILSWLVTFAMARQLGSFFANVCEPILRLIRQYIPSSYGGFDFSVMIAFLIIILVQNLLPSLF